MSHSNSSGSHSHSHANTGYDKQLFEKLLNTCAQDCIEGISHTNIERMRTRFGEEALETHNSCRQRHGVTPLSHNAELTRIAQEHAEHLAAKHELTLSHAKYAERAVGESLGFFFDSRVDYFTGEFVTLCWYNEIHNFDFDKNLFQPRTRNFSQIVWKNTKEVGFGIALSKDGGFYIVVTYHPAGNVMGQYSENVLKPVDK